MKRLLPVLLMLWATDLRAQSRELWLTVGASILSFTDANEELGSLTPNGNPGDVRIGNGFRIGVRFGFQSTRHIGHEIQYAYNRAGFTDQTGVILQNAGTDAMAIHQGGYNLLYYLTGPHDESKIRPFVTAGVHVNDFVLPGAGAVQGSSVKAGINYGGGLKLRLSSLFAARFDLRGYASGKPSWGDLLVRQSGPLQQMEASAGIGFFF